MKCIFIKSALLALLIATSVETFGKDVLLPYGDMNRWTIRKIHESAVIGGKTKTLYAIGPNRTIDIKRNGKGYGSCEDKQLRLP